MPYGFRTWGEFLWSHHTLVYAKINAMRQAGKKFFHALEIALDPEVLAAYGMHPHHPDFDTFKQQMGKFLRRHEGDFGIRYMGENPRLNSGSRFAILPVA